MVDRVGGAGGTSSLPEVSGEQEPGSGGVGGEREGGKSPPGHSGSL